MIFPSLPVITRNKKPPGAFAPGGLKGRNTIDKVYWLRGDADGTGAVPGAPPGVVDVPDGSEFEGGLSMLTGWMIVFDFALAICEPSGCEIRGVMKNRISFVLR